MPIYEYKCKDCDSKFEVLVFTQNEKIVCEKCGSENAERLLSGFASNVSGPDIGGSCGGSGGFS